MFVGGSLGQSGGVREVKVWAHFILFCHPKKFLQLPSLEASAICQNYQLVSYSSWLLLQEIWLQLGLFGPVSPDFVVAVYSVASVFSQVQEKKLIINLFIFSCLRMGVITSKLFHDCKWKMKLGGDETSRSSNFLFLWYLCHFSSRIMVFS